MKLFTHINVLNQQCQACMKGHIRTLSLSAFISIVYYLIASHFKA